MLAFSTTESSEIIGTISVKPFKMPTRDRDEREGEEIEDSVNEAGKGGDGQMGAGVMKSRASLRW